MRCFTYAALTSLCARGRRHSKDGLADFPLRQGQTALKGLPGRAIQQDIMAREPLGLHLFAALADLISKHCHHEIIGKIQ
jgi:hypothetical protein